MASGYGRLYGRKRVKRDSLGVRFGRIVGSLKALGGRIILGRAYVVFIWCMVVLSASLSVWDVAEAVFGVSDIPSVTSPWKCFVRYHPHAEGQLWLWLAAAMAVGLHSVVKKFAKAEQPEASTSLLPLAHVVLATTCIDIVAWSGACYWRNIGERQVRLRKVELGRAVWSDILIGCAAGALDFYVRDNKTVPKELSKEVLGKCPSTDFWGNELRLENDGGKYWILSSGSDGVIGTEDDLKCEVRTTHWINR